MSKSVRMGLAGMVVVLCIGQVCLGDRVYLYDGRVVKGKVASPDGAAIVKIETPFGPMQFKKSLVRKIVKGSPAAPPTTQPDSAGIKPPVAPNNGSGKSNPAARAKFAQTHRQADKLTSGAEGLALWEQYLQSSPPEQLAGLARKERATWKERADKDMVRFGPQWLPKKEVAERLSKADELVGRADSAADVDEAAKLYDQALKNHPYRVDIPFKKSLRYHRAKRMREFGTALGQVVRIDPNHVAARNNLGVLAAQQKHWGMALMNLGRAAAASDNDVILDSLDQVIAMAREAGAGDSITVAGDRQVRQVVARWHKEGRRVGETRWGNTWVSQARYQTYVKENAEVDKKMAANKTRADRLKFRYKKAKDIKARAERVRREATTSGTYVSSDLRYYQDLVEQERKADEEIKKIEAEVKKLRAESKELEGKKHHPPHAGKLVVLDADGAGQVDTVGVEGDKPREGGRLFD